MIQHRKENKNKEKPSSLPISTTFRDTDCFLFSHFLIGKQQKSEPVAPLKTRFSACCLTILIYTVYNV